jgi:lantibiotic modifying enzyme
VTPIVQQKAWAHRDRPDADCFAGLFEPFISVARDQFTRKAGSALAILSPHARAGLEKSLLKRLAETAWPALAFRYEIARQVLQPFSSLPHALLPGEHTPDFLRFIDRMRDGGLTELLAQYPVLERLLATVADFWVENAWLFLQRVQDDLKALQECFCPQDRLKYITTIEAGLSDPHHQGQMVMAATFGNGLKLFYKPGNRDLDAAWFRMLRQINEAGISLPFRCVRLLSRSEYGWMESLETRPCRDREQYRQYYYRAGMLLCLLYLFEGSDMHHENVIPSEDQPVPIDLETLMTPRMPERERGLRPRRFTETVLRAHFLPHWEIGTDRRRYDGGGMTVERRVAVVHDTIKDAGLSVEQGFTEMYRFLTAHQEVVEEFLDVCSACRVRTIFQDTRRYARLIRHSLHPQFLKCEEERNRELERLICRPFPPALLEKHMPRMRAEIRSITQLDIPYFETRSDSTDLQVSASVRIPDFFVEPCIRTVRRNFRQAGDDDLARQTSLIRDSFAFHAAPDDEARRRSGCLRVSGTFLPQERLTLPERNSSEMLLHAAADIGKSLRRVAIPTASGCLNWVFPEETVAGDGTIYRFQPCDSFLYQGYSGIALFLAALSRIRPESGYAGDARAALLPLEAWLQEPYCPSGIGIGAAHGLGSIVYALTRVAEWLDAADLLTQAGQMAEFITPGRIQSDTRLDLFDGAAGAIVGLLTLHAITDEPDVLDRAILCGDWLLARRVETECGLRAWNTIRATPVAGLSHGVAGIAYALLRLHQATGQKRFLQAAEEGMAFERTFFSAEHGNWRAFDSSEEEPDFWTTYCHGAPGIGLARLGGLPALDTPEIRDEISIAMCAAAEYPIEDMDFPCCGNFGRIEALFTGGLRLERRGLIELAQDKAVQTLRRKNLVGGFSVFYDLPPQVLNPGFFRGIAGIGYELLRLACPEQFPSVWLWE